MKPTLLLILLGCVAGQAQAQIQSVNGQTLGFKAKHDRNYIRPQGQFVHSFETEANQSATLFLISKYQLPFKGILQRAAPFGAVSGYNLINQKATTSSERSGVIRPEVPYIMAGVLFTSRGLVKKNITRKTRVDLVYRNKAGLVVKIQEHYIGLHKRTAIPMNSPVSGWVDVTLTAPSHRAVTLQSMNYVIDTVDTAPVDSPITQKQQPLPGPCDGCENGGGGGQTLETVFVYGRRTAPTYYEWQEIFTNFPDI